MASSLLTLSPYIPVIYFTVFSNGLSFFLFVPIAFVIGCSQIGVHLITPCMLTSAIWSFLNLSRAEDQ